MDVLLQAPNNFIKREKVNFLKTKFQLLNGELFLTEDRLILISNKTTIASGLLGRLIKKKIESKKFGFNLHLNDILEVRQTQHGIQKNVLEISDQSSNKYRIIVKDYPIWELTLKTYMKRSTHNDV